MKKEVFIKNIKTECQHVLICGREFVLVSFGFSDYTREMELACISPVQYGTVPVEDIESGKIIGNHVLAHFCNANTIPDAINARTFREETRGLDMAQLITYMKAKCQPD